MTNFLISNNFNKTHDECDVTFELCHIHILIMRHKSYENIHLNTPIIQQNNKSQLLSIIITQHATFIQRVEKLKIENSFKILLIILFSKKKLYQISNK